MFGGKRKLDDFSAEIEAHLQLETERLREQGLNEGEARAAARRAFGNLTQVQERFYESLRWLWLAYLWRDVRFGLRMLSKTPGFTAVAIVMLALGIGANTAIFSLIDSVMLNLLPVQNPEQLMQFSTRSPSEREPDPDFSNLVWEQIRDHQDVFSGTFATSDSKFDLAQSGESHNISGVYVSGDFFNTLGVHPVEGRLLTASDDIRGCPGVAVLSYAFWQEHYGGAASAVGNMVSLNRHSIQIIGVAPPHFFGVTVGKKFDVILPVCAEAIVPYAGEPDGTKFLDRPSAQWLRVMGRRKPGMSPERINARLQVLSSGTFAATVSPSWKPELQKEFLAGTLAASPAGGGISDLRRDYDQPLKLLMAVVGLVLLIACVNIASLMLGRGTARRKEIAVRFALGASRSQVIRQLLTECLLLSVLGALLGFFLARWGCAILVKLISSSKNPVFLQLAPDGHVLAFTASVAVLTGILFGVLPAFRATRVSLTAAMKSAQLIETDGPGGLGPGSWVVPSQVALSLVTLVIAGLFLRSFRNLVTLDLGFERTNVLLIETTVPQPILSPDRRAILYRQILGRLTALPGVTSAGESLVTPVSGNMWGTDFDVEKGAGPTGDDANAFMNFVSPGYFATLRSPLLAGRNFDEHDILGAQLVVIINESMARRFFPGAQPVGQYLLTSDFVNGSSEKLRMQVVGILKDTKYQSLRELNKSIAYFPIAQSEALTDPPIFEIRTAGQPSLLARSAEQAITGLNKSISLNFRTLESQVNDSLQREHLLATLSSFFGAVALVLAMTGLYGVLACMVTERRKELGIRMALGARKSCILQLIGRHIAVLVGTGMAAGVGVSMWVTHITQKMLFGLSPFDAKTMIQSVVLLASVALFAGYLPARRATRTDLMSMLRYE